MQRADRLLMTMLLACGLAVAGAWLGGLHWLGDSLALFVDYYLVAILLLLIALVWRRVWYGAGLATLLLALAAAQLGSYPHIAPAASPPAERSVRLLVYNIYHLNSDLDAVIATVHRYDPDMVFLMEYSDSVQSRIEDAFDTYPHRLIRTSRFTMGLALFSRLPIESAEIHRAEATRIPIFEARLRADGRPFSFVGGHPWAPQPQWAGLHRDQMEAITQVAERAAHPLIVAGDFNAAPWSYTMQRLAERGQLRLIRQPFSLAKSWQPLPGVGLPLDHVLVSEGWELLAQEYGPLGGSDHVPLIVDLQLR
jgi:endonuclease/exonuclease/phosphatase (EEP) superfamily protein YafD